MLITSKCFFGCLYNCNRSKNGFKLFEFLLGFSFLLLNVFLSNNNSKIFVSWCLIRLTTILRKSIITKRLPPHDPWQLPPDPSCQHPISERLRRMNVLSSSDDIQSLEPDGSWWWIIHNFLLSGSFEDDREPHEMLAFIFVTLFSPECPRAIINPVQMMEDFSWSWRKFPNCRLLLHFIFKPSIIGQLAPLKSSHWF